MESTLAIVGITLALIFAFLFSGLWISFTVGMVGIILLVLLVGGGMENMIGRVQFNTVAIFTYTMMPLFIFMGEIVLHSGMSGRLYRGATSLVGFLPGGLLHTNIAACSIFSAVSGSSLATAATIGTVAFPELEKRGYNRRLVTGSLSAGGSLGILIPPSLGFIIYGVWVEESIGRLFMAGIFPGLALAGLFMLYIAIASLIKPSVAPEKVKFSPRAMVASIPDILPMVVLIFVVLGTIYLGIVTPTESAAMGAFMALVFSALYRKLTWQVLKEAAVESAVLTSWILLIVVGAQILSMGLSYLQVPSELSRWIFSLGVNRLGILALVVIMYIIFGMFVDGISMMLLTLPVVYPVMMALGFDSIWFGVVLVILVEMAVITPPVGVNLFVIYGITGRRYLGDIIIGSIPFFICMNVMIIILTAFPSIATWLPAQMIQKW